MKPVSGYFPPPYIIKGGKCFKDERGSFMPLRVLCSINQVNVSISKAHTVRGMHWQCNHPQDKLLTCVAGSIHDVCVDMRKTSPTYLEVFEFNLDSGTGDQLYIPRGFAHGFESGDKTAVVLYMVDDEYDPSDERGFLWSSIGCWSTNESNAIVSSKDSVLPPLSEFAEGKHDEDLPKDGDNGVY